jgi:magnesium-transporting ATPase (P-type)
MKDTIDIKTEDDYKETGRRTEKKKPKSRKINKYGIYISIIFILAGLIWYGINLGIIPIELIIQQAGPVAIILLGILILIVSIKR